MTAEIERALRKLIDEHGFEKIDEALAPLIAKFRWDDWQRVYNLAHRIAKRPRNTKLGANSRKSAVRRKTNAPK